MKKIFLSFIIFLGLFFNINVFTENIKFTQDSAIFILKSIQDSVNSWDVDSIIENVSPKAKIEIIDGIISNIKWKKIEFVQELKSFETLENWNFKINAFYSAKWLNWNVSGFSNYYILELVDGNVLIVDTNFYQFSPKIFSLLWPFIPFIFLFWFIFFIWMLNDCIKREIENKWMWILLIIFVPLGSFIYFFKWRKKFPLKEKYQKK